MTATGASIGSVVKSLWARAPLWRFALVAAAFSSLLFIFFPPEITSGVDIPQQNVGVPLYVPQQMAQTEPANQTPPALPKPPQSVPVTTAKRSTPPAQPSPQTTSSPTTASLSLAAPNGTATKAE